MSDVDRSDDDDTTRDEAPVNEETEVKKGSTPKVNGNSKEQDDFEDASSVASTSAKDKESKDKESSGPGKKTKKKKKKGLAYLRHR